MLDFKDKGWVAGKLEVWQVTVAAAVAQSKAHPGDILSRLQGVWAVAWEEVML